MQATIIHDENQLRNFIKPYSKVLDKRIQSKLDALSIEFLNHTSLMVLYSGLSQGFYTINQRGFNIENPHTIEFNGLQIPPQNISAYCIIAGIDHGLRINGILNSRHQLQIQDVYFQYGRAMQRAKLFQNQPEANFNIHSTDITSKLDEDHKKFIESSFYTLLGTQNQKLKTEISPRGNRYTIVEILDNQTIKLVEHKGNKVAISLRNMLEVSDIALCLFNSRENQLLSIKGKSTIIAEKVPDNKPELYTKIDITTVQFIPITDDGLFWQQDQVEKHALTPFSKAINTHINGNGFKGRMSQPIVDIIIRHEQNHLFD